MSLFALAEFGAKHNFDGFDPTDYYFPGYRARKLPNDRLMFELDLSISGTGVENNFTVTDDAASSARPLSMMRASMM